MIAPMVWAMGPAFVLGLAIAVTGLPRLATRSTHGLCVFGYGLVLGPAISSVVHFVELVVFDRRGPALYAVESWVLLVLAFVLFLRATRVVAGERTVRPQRSAAPVFVPLVVVAATLLVFAVGSFLQDVRAHPFGFGDGLAIWSKHAKFLTGAGASWRNLFSPLNALTHPDYPLLVPAAVAHAWVQLGTDATAPLWIVHLSFYLGTVAMLTASLAHFRGWNVGLLGAVCLLGAGPFEHCAAQFYADVPLSSYVLGVLVLFALYGESASKLGLLLMGFLLASAAWCKNEGWLFVLVFPALQVVAHSWIRGVRAALRSLTWMALGGGSVLACLFYFKRFLAPTNDLLTADNLEQLRARLSDPERYWSVLRHLGTELLGFGDGLFLVVVGAAFAFGRHRDRTRWRGFWVVPATLLLMLFGYALVYVATSRVLQWHLQTSASRLLLQLWPGFLFALLCFVRDLEPSPAASEREARASTGIEPPA